VLKTWYIADMLISNGTVGEDFKESARSQPKNASSGPALLGTPWSRPPQHLTRICPHRQSTFNAASSSERLDELMRQGSSWNQ
jgi:hypothetical protein